MKFKPNRTGWDIAKPKVIILALFFFVASGITYSQNRPSWIVWLFFCLGIGPVLLYAFFEYKSKRLYDIKKDKK